MAAVAPTLGAFQRPAHAFPQRRNGASRRAGRPVSRVSPRAVAPSWLTETAAERASLPDDVTKDAPLRVLVAGGGLGGLFAAISLRNAGADVVVIERTSQYRPFGGPIQLASNGVSTIKATSESLFRKVHDVSRPFWRTTSGIRDGLKGNWMFTFGAITEIPDENDLPFSICVDRSDLQEVLLDEIRETRSRGDGDGDVNGNGIFVQMGSSVSRYENVPRPGGGVRVTLDDGSEITADVLVGADGIWSKVRAQMFREPSGVKGAGSTASFTGYKLYSGLPVFQPYYYEDVGYSAFIGPDHYFVACPDRSGRVQWYAFIKATAPNAPDQIDPSAFLRTTLKGWAPEVLELIRATDSSEIQQRDLWDRFPSVARSWADGCATLLGDSCHATMPNIGQGAGLAFEDGYELSRLLKDVKKRSEVPKALSAFYRNRIVRTAAVQGLGRMNSEAIKVLTPLLPVRPLVEYFIGPFLPLVFRAQFGYCYSFCPEKMDAREARELADAMRARHGEEARVAWTEAEKKGLAVTGVENKHEIPAVEVIAN
jgi:zeaxanthin epoxidase